MATSRSASHHARLGYMPALDGVRALAVAAVLLYHGEVSWARGGYLGVDAFFVLSGFLITSLLLAEWRDEGRIALSAFWARRARRLLPAFFLVLGAVALYGAVIAAPTELERLRHDGLSALGYIANWGQVFSHQSYFQSFAAPSPLRHTWSLAIEDQFYLVWPLLVVGVLRWRRGSVRSLTAVTGGLLACSAVWMIALHQPGTDPSRVYYGTDTRAQSLLMGALLALPLARRSRPSGRAATNALHSVALVAAGALGWIWVHTSERADWLYRGGFTLCAVLVAIVIASVTRTERGPLGALLSLRPAALGRRGLVRAVPLALAAVRPHQPRAHRPRRCTALRRPHRRDACRRDGLLLPRRTADPAGRVEGIAAANCGAGDGRRARHRDGAHDGRRRDAAGGGRGRRHRAAAHGGRPTRPDRTRARHVVGDSVANSMAPGLERAGPAQGLTVWNAAVDGCGITQDVGEQRVWGWQPPRRECVPGWRERWPLQLSQFNPDVVVMLLGTDDAFDRKINGQEITFDSPAGDQLTRNELQEAITMLSAGGARVVALTTPYHVIGWPRQVRLDRSSYNPVWVNRWNDNLRAVATHNPTTTTIIDFNRFLCPEGKWTDNINGVNVRRFDKMHLSDEGADMAASWLAPQLVNLARAPVPTANASVGTPPPVAPRPGVGESLLGAKTPTRAMARHDDAGRSRSRPR